MDTKLCVYMSVCSIEGTTKTLQNLNCSSIGKQLSIFWYIQATEFYTGFEVLTWKDL